MDSGIIILIVIIAFLLFIIYYSSYIQTKAKKQRTELLKYKDASLTFTLLHLQGLPIAEHISTQIFSCPNEYEFIANNNSFKLSKSKVSDIAITNNIEAYKNQVSSIGGAVGGAILFGPLGAIIGGRAKGKTSIVNHSFLVFTYLDNNEIKYLSFDCSNNLKVRKLIKEFKQSSTRTNITVNL